MDISRSSGTIVQKSCIGTILTFQDNIFVFYSIVNHFTITLCANLCSDYLEMGAICRFLWHTFPTPVKFLSAQDVIIIIVVVVVTAVFTVTQIL